MRSSLSMQRQHAPCAVSASLAAWRPSPVIPRRPKANTTTTTTTTTLRNSPSTSTFPTTSSHPSQRLCVCSSSSSSSSGSIWDSEVVQKEFEVMMRDFADMMKLQRGFPDFDLDGKEIYLDRLDGLAERMRIFVTRMRLSGDAQAKEWLHLLNIQLLEAGLSVDTLQEGLKGSTDMMRECVAAERLASSAGPQAAAAFRERLRAQFDSIPDVSKILTEDPEVAAALSDPLVLAAFKDAIQLGEAEMEAKYGGNERVMLVVRKLMTSAKGGGRGPPPKGSS